MAEYVPHRHKCGDGPLMNAVLIWSTVGEGVDSSSSVALIIMPCWQNPHIGTCSLIHACCTGCSVPAATAGDRPFWLAHRADSPSIVVTCLSATLLIGSTQARTSLPSTSTEHAPHCDRPQPNWGLPISRSFR